MKSFQRIKNVHGSHIRKRYFKAKFYIQSMIKMVFDNLISFANDVDFQATSICTEWKSVKKYEDRDDYPNYDYFPEEENGKIVGFFGKDKQGNIKKVKGKKPFLINEKTNILETIVSLNKNYSVLKNERIKRFFCYLGNS